MAQLDGVKLSKDEIKEWLGKESEILKFDAADARENYELDNNEELITILSKIKKKSKTDRLLHVSDTLSLKTRTELESRGFVVTNHNSISSQRSDINHTINW